MGAAVLVIAVVSIRVDILHETKCSLPFVLAKQLALGTLLRWAGNDFTLLEQILLLDALSTKGHTAAVMCHCERASALACFGPGSEPGSRPMSICRHCIT